MSIHFKVFPRYHDFFGLSIDKYALLNTSEGVNVFINEYIFAIFLSTAFPRK